MCLPESLKIRHIGFHKRFYFPLTEIPEQQHKASDENNEEENSEGGNVIQYPGRSSDHSCRTEHPTSAPKHESSWYDYLVHS